jgi:UDP-N-acetylmuramyl pentapeptide synthase
VAREDRVGRGDVALALNGAQHGPRHIRPAELFAALKGAGFHGKNCVGPAVANGAAALLVGARIHPDAPQITTSFSLAALEEAYRQDIESYIRADNTMLPRLEA